MSLSSRPLIVRPPLAPRAFQRLLTRAPMRAAAVLLAMRPQAYLAQAQAHAVLRAVSLAQITREWAALLRTCASQPTPIAAADPPARDCIVDPHSLAAPMVIIARADARKKRP